ncbi:hypothetical protein DSO57_1026064 [Entomophthora muscae]|uniref:Uncharacterized protein n=1 Tax=Entomophthora muscae TaxID=34485 RepID=A0ACC2TD26_9FUNG|nr:hypothetical protein DSO57_1026064 [Entomophthora muscae]
MATTTNSSQAAGDSWMSKPFVDGHRTSFRDIVVLGDSFSDTGNLFNATGQRFPPSPYFQGRFSNGPLWIEYVANQYNATLLNYAVVGATSDDSVYNVSFEHAPGVKIDGCIEQMRHLKSDPQLKRLQPEDTLVSFSFFGNDFTYPGATAEKTVEALGACLSQVLSYKQFDHVFVPYSNVPEVYPRVRAKSIQEQTHLSAISLKYRSRWQAKIKEISRSFPETTFYMFDFGLLITYLSLNPPKRTTSPRKRFCLEPPSVCSNPSEFLFWDDFHFNADVHKTFGEKAIGVIKDPSSIYGYVFKDAKAIT